MDAPGVLFFFRSGPDFIFLTSGPAYQCEDFCQGSQKAFISQINYAHHRGAWYRATPTLRTHLKAETTMFFKVVELLYVGRWLNF